MSSWSKRFLMLSVAVAAALLLFAGDALGQCSMCKASLAGANNPSFIRQFNIAVLVLLIPPVTMFCSIFIVLRKHKRLDDEENASLNAPATELDRER